MGFLKFLKRGKKENLEELDLPPEPPNLDEFGKDFDTLPELPDSSDIDKDLPQLDIPEDIGKYADSTEGMPEFPDLPEMEDLQEPIPNIRAPSMPRHPMPSQMYEEYLPEPKEAPVVEEQPKIITGQPAQEPKVAMTEHYSMHRRLFKHERMPAREMLAGKSIYVKVDNFKAMIGSISMVRSDLKKSEGALMKLETIKNSKDMGFDKVKSSLEDLQKKLIFIDKTLFKGE